MDKKYEIISFPKWLLWGIKLIPFIILFSLCLALMIQLVKPPTIKEVMVYKQVECDTIQDITSMMHSNDTRIFSVKRLSGYSFEVMTQSKDGHITRVIHSWE